MSLELSSWYSTMTAWFRFNVYEIECCNNTTIKSDNNNNMFNNNNNTTTTQGCILVRKLIFLPPPPFPIIFSPNVTPRGTRDNLRSKFDIIFLFSCKIQMKLMIFNPQKKVLLIFLGQQKTIKNYNTFKRDSKQVTTSTFMRDSKQSYYYRKKLNFPHFLE